MTLFEHVEKSVQLVNVTKRDITKWTTSFYQVNKMMGNCTTTLRERANQVQEQLHSNKLLKE